MPLYITLLHTAFMTELGAIVPIIVLLLAVGTATATLQAAFQLEDTALSLLPKTIAMIAIAVLGGFGALTLFKALAMAWIGHAGDLVHQPWS
jgi:flagellar biosynthesis protein FliQ